MRLIAVMLLVLVGGCASQAGNFSAQDASKYATISVDKTTKGELREVMGQPAGVLYKEDQTGWVYVQMEQKIHGSTFVPFVGLFTGGSVFNIKATTFWFSSAGILLNTDFEAHNEYVNMWEGLAQAVAAMGAEGSEELTMYRAVEGEMVFIGEPYTENESDLKAVAMLWGVRRSL